MSSLTLKSLQPEYEEAYKACQIRPEVFATVRDVAKKMVELRSHYEAVERDAGVPWWFAGIIHYREWGFLEPDLFQKQVTDILISKKYHQARNHTIGAYLWGFDLWNGFRDGSGKQSAWVWGGTNVFNQATDKVGVAAILNFLQANKMINFTKPGDSIELLVLADTVFKAKPEQTTSLGPTEKLSVPAGTRLQLVEDDPAPKGHVKVILPDGVLRGQNNRLEWYIYSGHIQVEGTEANNQPNDPVQAPETKIDSPDRGRAIVIPKLGTVYLGDPVLKGGHFSWAEVTKNGTRIPGNATIVDGMLRIAEVMEEVRELFDNRPITVNSWYRDPASNRAAGGASKSRHMVGDAIDFTVQGISPPNVHRKLEPWWGSRGGIASASCFTHIDARGYRARWKYPF